MAPLKLSYVHGVSNQPLIGETVGQFFDSICARWPSRPALIVRHQKVRLTYAELQRQVDRVAAGLLTLGLEPGDRIGIWSPNTSEWVLTQFATAKAGLILVNINPAYRIAELEYALNKVGCKALILAERFKTSDYIGMLRELAPELGHAVPGKLESARLPALRSVVLLGDNWHPGTLRFSEITTRGGSAEAARIAELAPQL
ncbi:MAG: AMP-binding protein, partial [Xanthobacteraceae bacterium]